MKEVVQKRIRHYRRHARVRSRLSGTAARPRLSVFRSSGHIYAQLIDDVAGRTLAAASSLRASGRLKKIEAARIVGRALAAAAVEHGIRRVVFDRGGYAYHGRVKAVAEGACEAGLQF